MKQEYMAIARLKQEKIIRRVLRKKNNLFLYGPAGAGKTFIVKHLLKELPGADFLYSPDSSTLKKALSGFISKEARLSEFPHLNLFHLKKLFYDKIEKPPCYLVFDHLAKVGPKYLSFLENIMNRVPLIIIAGSPYARDIGDCIHLLWSFECLEISNFKQGEAYKFIEFCKNDFLMDKVNWEAFKKEVFYISGGNPRVIKEICRYARKNKYHRGDKINFNLINLDRKISASCTKL